MRAALALALALTAGSARAESTIHAFDAFLQREGCAIGPSVLERAAAQGLDVAYFERLASPAVEEGVAQTAGDWVLLGPEVCKILMPVVDAEFSLENLPPFHTVRYYEAGESVRSEGCYLESQIELAVLELAELRDIDVDAAHKLITAFKAREIALGRLVSGYSDNPMFPPWTRVTATGHCGEAPDIADLQAHQNWVQMNFGTITRAGFEQLTCGEAGSLDLGAVNGLSGETPNGYPLWDIFLLQDAAGWSEGAGTGRPPICRPAN